MNDKNQVGHNESNGSQRIEWIIMNQMYSESNVMNQMNDKNQMDYNESNGIIYKDDKNQMNENQDLIS